VGVQATGQPDSKSSDSFKSSADTQSRVSVEAFKPSALRTTGPGVTLAGEPVQPRRVRKTMVGWRPRPLRARADRLSANGLSPPRQRRPSTRSGVRSDGRRRRTTPCSRGRTTSRVERSERRELRLDVQQLHSGHAARAVVGGEHAVHTREVVLSDLGRAAGHQESKSSRDGKMNPCTHGAARYHRSRARWPQAPFTGEDLFCELTRGARKPKGARRPTCGKTSGSSCAVGPRARATCTRRGPSPCHSGRMPIWLL